MSSHVVWIILIGFLAAIFFIVVELLFRIFYPKFARSYALRPNSQTRLLLDPSVFPNLERVVEHRINSEGERGDELPTNKSDVFRVLVAGGSAAEGWFIDQRSSWPYVIQEILSQDANLKLLNADHVHVGNIGRSFVASRHLDLILSRVLQHYRKLDVLVLMIGASDLLHWLQNGAPECIENKYISSTNIFGQHPDAPFGWRPRKMAISRFGVSVFRRIVKRMDIRLDVGKQIASSRAMRQNATKFITDMPDPSGMLDNFDKYLKSIIQRAKQKTDCVIVLRQPWLDRKFTPSEEKLLWNYAQGRPYESNVSTYYSHEVVWKLHHLIDQHTEIIASNLGVHSLELNSIVKPDFDNYYDDLHYTPLGCRVIGEAVAKEILRINQQLN